MNKKIKEFMELMKRNPELKLKVETLNKLPDTTEADFIALAGKCGIEMSDADLAAQRETVELTSDELKAIVGGASSTNCTGLSCICRMGHMQDEF